MMRCDLTRREGDGIQRGGCEEFSECWKRDVYEAVEGEEVCIDSRLNYDGRQLSLFGDFVMEYSRL